MDWHRNAQPIAASDADGVGMRPTGAGDGGPGRGDGCGGSDRGEVAVGKGSGARRRGRDAGPDCVGDDRDVVFAVVGTRVLALAPLIDPDRCCGVQGEWEKGRDVGGVGKRECGW